MKPLSAKSSFFWIVFLLLSALSASWAYRYFPVAFPLVTLDLSMDRAAALSAAQELAKEHSWTPDSYRSTASFGVDSRAQAFIELEAGGAGRFSQLLAYGPYSPYTWQVRLFQPGETLEASFRFRPDGRAYAFALALPDDRAGPDLEEEVARSIGEAATAEPFGIDLAKWESIDTATELLTAGRRDHIFVYRHRDLELGEGELRLRLRVGGDRLTELTPFVWLPDSFDRRYEQMRSANRAVSGVASFAMAVLYLLGGCLGGLFWLSRTRSVEARPAWIWGFALAFMQVLSAINEWPLLWMSYDTALSPLSHMLWETLGLFLQLIGLGFLFTLTFMAAEGLGRKAFPDHHQFWKSWSKDVGNSPGILGQTVGGYLLVAAFFAYEVALYVLAHRHLGWWTPSDALLHPDVLATYVPWFSSIAISAQAGFWEECLFRAVPLAGAALLGQRFGRRRLFIVSALVLQALIFGAAHANYATQPAWARLTELALPAFGFGLLYLRFGLLPTIVLHYAFDVVWFALPLFVSEAPGLGDDRLLVLLSTLLPLGMVLFRRLQAGEWLKIADRFRNRAWTPSPFSPPRAPLAAPARPLLQGRHRRAVLAAGLIGTFAMAGWTFFLEDPSDAPALTVRRSAAVTEATRELQGRGIELRGDGWKVLATPLGNANSEHLYVWDQAGKATYRDLLGSYLGTPGWQIRWARFAGDVVDRSEEVHVILSPDGELRRFIHSLPESSEGMSLEEDQAAILASDAALSLFGIRSEDLEKVAFSSEQQPARRDWVVTWSDPSVTLGEGRAKVVVEIAGNEVVDAYRAIDIPQTWQRERREERSLTIALQVVAWLIFTVGIVAMVVFGIVRWSHLPVSVHEIVIWATVMATLGMTELLNRWPILEARFSTAQSSWLQATMVLGSETLTLLVTAGGMGLLAALLRSWWPESAVFGRSRFLLGLSGGAVTALALTIASSGFERVEPRWPEIGNAGRLLPSLAAVTGPLLLYLQITLIGTLLVLALDRLSAAGRRRPAAMLASSLALGWTVAGLAGSQQADVWLLQGSILGLVFFLAHRWLFRYDLGLVPLSAATLVAFSSFGEAIAAPYPGARLGSLIAALVIMASGWIWSRRWSSSLD